MGLIGRRESKRSYVAGSARYFAKAPAGLGRDVLSRSVGVLFGLRPSVKRRSSCDFPNRSAYLPESVPEATVWRDRGRRAQPDFGPSPPWGPSATGGSSAPQPRQENRNDAYICCSLNESSGASTSFSVPHAGQGTFRSLLTRSSCSKRPGSASRWRSSKARWRRGVGAAQVVVHRAPGVAGWIRISRLSRYRSTVPP